MNLTAATASRLRAGAPDPGASWALSARALWRTRVDRLGSRLSAVALPPWEQGMPQKFGDHYRWPDGTWHHCS